MGPIIRRCDNAQNPENVACAHISHEERSEELSCFHVVVKRDRYSLEERVFIVKTYWITGSIKIARGGSLNSLLAETHRQNVAFNF
jgi:hypothetical protein